MKISGFTFIKNGILLGYPFIESIESLLMLCDEVVVAVGLSEDDTLNKVRSITNPKLRVIETTWNDQMSDRGYTYAQQKMIAQFNCTGDWAFYLECDEIIHEKDIQLIKSQMSKYLTDYDVEALIFDYYHFYGSPDTVAISPRWYRSAPRIIRNNIRSWAPDGLFWLIMDKNKVGRYPKAAPVKCYIYHYGHARSISSMHEKNKRVELYWGNQPSNFIGYGDIDPKTIFPFTGLHPNIIKHWIKSHAEQQFVANPHYKPTLREKRHRFIAYLGKLCGDYDFSKKHYKLIR